MAAYVLTQPAEVEIPVVTASPTTPTQSKPRPAMPLRRSVLAMKMKVPKSQLAVVLALKQVGKPYQWGSKGPNSFDCSGLIQWSYQQIGVSLGPDTYTQVNDGHPVKGSPMPGDLVFPAAEMGSNGPGHVVLAISATQAVEAPGSGLTVRVIPMPPGEARRVV